MRERDTEGMNGNQLGVRAYELWALFFIFMMMNVCYRTICLKEFFMEKQNTGAAAILWCMLSGDYSVASPRLNQFLPTPTSLPPQNSH